MKTEFDFLFENYPSRVLILDELPDIRDLSRHFYANCPALLVCDSNTEGIARKILRKTAGVRLLTLESGENTKSWEPVEAILRSARSMGLGRDGLFVGIGGGVTSDLTAFAASIYMRGVRLCLVSTTLLGMVDASIGGKTGIDLFTLKNMAGTFYPAGLVVLPLEALDTLSEKEWKSGMAELIKMAVIDSEDFFELMKKLISLEENGRQDPHYRACLKECISRAVAIKGRIVEADFRETGKERVLLHLGHTFGHALESAAGLGLLSHGEAVAWGIARSCELGMVMGFTPKKRAMEITETLNGYGYEIKAPHPLIKSQEFIWNAMQGDKKQAAKKLKFIVPGETGVQVIEDNVGEDLLKKILNGECPI